MTDDRPLDFSMSLYITLDTTEHSQEPEEHLQHKRQMPGQHNGQHREELGPKMPQDWSVIAVEVQKSRGDVSLESLNKGERTHSNRDVVKGTHL